MRRCSPAWQKGSGKLGVCPLSPLGDMGTAFFSPLCQPTGFKPVHACWSEITDQVPGSSKLQRANLTLLQSHCHHQLALQPQLPHLAPDAGPQHSVLSPEGCPSSLCQHLCVPPCPLHHTAELCSDNHLQERDSPRGCKFQPSSTDMVGLLVWRDQESPAKSHHSGPGCLHLLQHLWDSRGTVCAQQSPKKHCSLTSGSASGLGVEPFLHFGSFCPPPPPPPPPGCCKTSQGASVQTQGQE